MIDKEIILKKIESILLKYSLELNLDLMLDKRYCKEYTEYIVFVYNSCEYIKFKKVSFALAGNLPLIANKFNGHIYQLLDCDCDFDNTKFEDLPLSNVMEV